MQYSKFPASGIEMSKLTFGAMGLNCAFGHFDEKNLIATLLGCLERGVNVIDTARTYGQSEEIVGKALKQWRGDKPFVATKVAPTGTDANNGWGIPNEYSVAYPEGSVTKSVEESLIQLGLDSVDLVQLHQFWSQYENEAWLFELQKLKQQGKIKHIGISIPDHRHDQGLSIVRSGLVDSVQTIINVFDPLAFDSLVPLCQERGVAVIARCILDEGGLTGFLEEGMSFPETDFRCDYFDRGPMSEYLRRVRRLEEQYVPKYAASLTELAIRYVLSHPGVTTATVSMHIQQYAEQNIAIAGMDPLPEKAFADIRMHHRWLVNLYDGKYFPKEGEVLSATGFKDK